MSPSPSKSASSRSPSRSRRKRRWIAILAVVLLALPLLGVAAYVASDRVKRVVGFALAWWSASRIEALGFSPLADAEGSGLTAEVSNTGGSPAVLFATIVCRGAGEPDEVYRFAITDPASGAQINQPLAVDETRTIRLAFLDRVAGPDPNRPALAVGQCLLTSADASGYQTATPAIDPALLTRFD